MIITLTRTGGFTGIPQKKTIDTKNLPPEKTKEIENLVAKANLAPGQPQGVLPTKPQPDRFIYTITIQNESFTNSLPLQEESMDPEVEKLIHYIDNISG